MSLRQISEGGKVLCKQTPEQVNEIKTNLRDKTGLQPETGESLKRVLKRIRHILSCRFWFCRMFMREITWAVNTVV